MTTLITVLAVSLLGSLHCAGMCGALVAFAVGSPQRQSRFYQLKLQLGYHGGRLASYMLIGAACGLLGAAVDFGGTLVGLNRIAAVLAGLMMVTVGLFAVAKYSGWSMPRVSGPRFLERAVVAAQRAAFQLSPFRRALSVGLLTAFLPCGWLYAFAIVAAGTGSAAMGAAVMSAFWLGTVPILASVGIGVQTLAGTLGRRIPVAASLIIVGLGLYTIAARPAISIDALKPAIAVDGTQSTEETVKTIQHEALPCCQRHAKPPSQ